MKLTICINMIGAGPKQGKGHEFQDAILVWKNEYLKN